MSAPPILDGTSHPAVGVSAAPRRRAPGFVERVVHATANSEDIAAGQIVIVTARWILFAAGLVLVLWNPAGIGALRVGVFVLLVIAVANFVQHAQLLRRRPTVDSVAYLLSAADIAVITVLVASQGGFDSNVFIFYFPALLALSVAFPTIYTLLFTAGTIGVYAGMSLADLGSGMTGESAQVLITRALMLGAVAICGAIYWHVEADRRRGAAEGIGHGLGSGTNDRG